MNNTTNCCCCSINSALSQKIKCESTHHWGYFITWNTPTRRNSIIPSSRGFAHPWPFRYEARPRSNRFRVVSARLEGACLSIIMYSVSTQLLSPRNSVDPQSLSPWSYTQPWQGILDSVGCACHQVGTVFNVYIYCNTFFVGSRVQSLKWNIIKLAPKQSPHDDARAFNLRPYCGWYIYYRIPGI